MDFKKINFKAPKYALPAILYFPILFLGYFTIDLFQGSSKSDDSLGKKDDYLMSDLPETATDSILGDKISSMQDQYGNITDLSAVDGIENDRDSLNKKQEYESRYNGNEAALVRQQENLRSEGKELRNMQSRVIENRNTPSDYISSPRRSDIKKMENRRRTRKQQEMDDFIYGSSSYNPSTSANYDFATDDSTNPSKDLRSSNGIPQYDSNGNEITIPNAGTSFSSGEPQDFGNAGNVGDKTNQVVKKIKESSDYFNTISRRNAPSKLIRAIVDENVKAVDGSRVRLRLLDDIEVGDATVRKGTYLYVQMSGFSQQRVHGTIQSIFSNDNIFSVSLSIYDTDGLPGLYVPRSSFREASKEIMESATQGGTNIIDNNVGNTTGIKGWANQTVQNASQKVMNSVGKIIRRNVVHIKYGTLVYLIDESQIQQSSRINKK